MSRQLHKLPLVVACGFALLPAFARAESPATRPAAPSAAKDFSKSSVVTRMMAFDKNADGKLTKEEITDSRLLNLFADADADKDGVVTKDELIALAAKIEAEMPSQGPGGGRGPRRGPPPGGRGGPGGPGGPPPR